MEVREIMTDNIITVKKEATIQEAARLMLENNISSIPVVDDSRKVIGIISEKDLIYKDVNPSVPAVVEYLGGLIFLEGVEHYKYELRKLAATNVEQTMNTHVVTVKENDTINEAARILVHENFNTIPVLREGRLVGVVSCADIVRTLLQE